MEISATAEASITKTAECAVGTISLTAQQHLYQQHH